MYYRFYDIEYCYKDEISIVNSREDLKIDLKLHHSAKLHAF